MNCQCIDLASFASGRKQTSHGVVRDIRFSVGLSEILVVLRVIGPCTCDV